MSLLIGPWRSLFDFENAIFSHVLLIGIFQFPPDNALRWPPYDQTDLGQVMAWCHQATIDYLSQYWPSSMSSHAINRDESQFQKLAQNRNLWFWPNLECTSSNLSRVIIISNMNLWMMNCLSLHNYILPTVWIYGYDTESCDNKKSALYEFIG